MRNQSSNTPSETEVVVKNLQEETTAQVPEDIVEEAEDSRGLYERHSETKPTVLTESACLAVDRNAGVTSKKKLRKARSSTG
ncbi:hypothetical protein M378DRAFT_172349 [Amanita muscaria Koide BX008]|uniref:Uncharacterized protein n=1 Tax=Amanita muscaria (strain Koide BX008) TaxID=946122 RepID=A0A0C2WKW6_AMAMK|nr:hypothetical protein M378DRAFT_172349 [Amanita muscaria Koide BX008]